MVICNSSPSQTQMTAHIDAIISYPRLPFPPGRDRIARPSAGSAFLNGENLTKLIRGQVPARDISLQKRHTYKDWRSNKSEI